MPRGRKPVVTEKDVKDIRFWYAQGHSLIKIADTKKVAHSTIYLVVTGKHVNAKGLPDISRKQKGVNLVHFNNIYCMTYANLYGSWN